MPRVLCVAEKPSISKSITQILSGGRFNTRNSQNKYIKNYDFDYAPTGSSFTVTCVTGHLSEHDFFETHRKWYSCDPFDLFDAQVDTVIRTDNKSIETNLYNEARTADSLMIWTDCDREGEHIGSEIARVCKRARRNIVVKRARFSAIVAQQIHNAAQHPRNLDQRQADAVEARMILDLKIGAAFTRFQTLSLKPRIPNLESFISYGPCQFPTLGFVVSRYQEVQSFRPEQFWYIYLSLIREGEETRFTWRRGHLFEEDVALVLYEHVMQNPVARVTKVVKKETKKWKPLPLTTVELQKAGSRLLKLAPKKVLDIAEKLYQQGFLSYPRTETDQFDNQFDFMSLIEKQTVDPGWGDYARRLQQDGFNMPRKGKNNDKAHPPIHPTAHVANLAGDAKKVYEYITRRFLACCSEDAVGSQTTVDVECGDESFYATGLIVIARSYLEVYPYDKWTTNVLPNFAEGEIFDPSVCELRDGQTTKPSLLTEADLVALMDKNGIGTDATIAQHIDTIIQREYVLTINEGATKYLLPSTLGIGLVEGYNRVGFNKSLSKPQLRRETERRMVQVCEGTKTKFDIISQSIEQYKEMYVIARREFNKVAASVQHYIGQGEGGGGGGGGDNGGGGNGGHTGGAGSRGRGRGRGGGGSGGGSGPPAGGNEDGNEGGGDSGTAGGTRGRGRPRGGGPSSRGRRPAPSNDSPSEIEFIDDDYTPPASKKIKETHSKRASSTSAVKPPSTTSLSTKPPSQKIASNSKGASNEIHCQCNIPAVQRTVKQESASKGRLFWTCGCNRACNFFQFVDQPAASGSAAASSSQTTGSSDDQPPQCDCHKPAITRTVVNDEKGNKGRVFWTCDSRTCKFFQWKDDLGSSVPSKRTFSNSQVSNSNNDDDAGSTRQCSCKVNAAKHVVQKEGPNKGREFLKCASGRCEFWEWNDEPPRSTTGARNTSDECYKCGRTGHWASSCPNEASTSKRPRSFGSSRGNAPETDVCYKCNRSGHWSSDCPGTDMSYTGKRRTQSSRGGSSYTKGGSTRGRGRGKATRNTKTKSGFSAPAGFAV